MFCFRNHAYCLIGECDQQLANKIVHVSTVKKDTPWKLVGGNHYFIEATKIKDAVIITIFYFKIKKIIVFLKNLPRKCITQFERTYGDRKGKHAIEHVIGTLIDRSMGSRGFETQKNITIDLMMMPTNENDSTLMEKHRLWRDRCGFCVTDRFKYAEIVVDRTKFNRYMI